MVSFFLLFTRVAPIPGVAASPSQIDYLHDVRPILERRCFACHSRLKQKGGLRLDAGSLLVKGGESGSPVISGKSSESLLIKRVTTDDPEERMPKDEKPLSPGQIATLKTWVDQGAQFPQDEKIPSSPKDHWAFQPLQRPKVPQAPNAQVFSPFTLNPSPLEPGVRTRSTASAEDPKNKNSDAVERVPTQSVQGFDARDFSGKSPLAGERVRVRGVFWSRNPIDFFVLAKLAARGWSPAAQAQAPALLRRIHLDVTGLPPTPREQEQFLENPTDESLDAVIDDLLSRPAYGERWARHWLDVVRYAESNGYERDAAKPFVWRYRDYIIRSLNSDKPFDRFLVEQLAGDELPDANAETMIATGYLRLGHWDDEPADPETDRFDQLDDIVSTTSQVFLGLTLGCARCHDHKFEPLSTRDYYSMVALFNPLQRPRNGREELALPAGSRAELDAEAERDRRMAAIRREIAEVLAAARENHLKSGQSKLAADVVEAFLTTAKQRNDAQKKAVEKFTKQLDQEVTASLLEREKAKIQSGEKQIAALRAARPDLPRGYFMQETSAIPPATYVLLRGQPSRRGAEVPPAVPAIVAAQQPIFPQATDRTSLRRLTLARWLASPENPLTARVIVNRVWQYHFGLGLVRTPNDFGLLGEEPTHPELLDWLAHWFVHDGRWSMKKLHRLIMTSRAYRISRTNNPDYAASDPENRLLWRMPYRRLEVEAIRDSMLSVSGQLHQQMFGPSMYPEIPKAALDGNSDPDKIWKAFDPRDASRRTLYAFIKRSLVVPMLDVFDLGDTTQSCGRRMVTTVAPQALTLFNGEFAKRQSRHFAERLGAEAGANAKDQIDLAYRLALCRKPTAGELSAMIEFLRSERERWLETSGGGSETSNRTLQAEQNALVQLCRVILNLNEFVYPD